MTSPSITAYRVFHYLKRHGVMQGSRRLYRVFRQMHELRLGNFMGKDLRGNEYYLDPFAQWGRQRFVLYRDGRTPHTPHSRRRSAVALPLETDSSSLCRWVDKGYDPTDVCPDWHWWLHAIGDETPKEVHLLQPHRCRSSLPRASQLRTSPSHPPPFHLCLIAAVQVLPVVSSPSPQSAVALRLLGR